MKEGLLTMSLIEVERVTVIEQVIQKKIKQQAACQQLKLSARQVKRLVKAYRQEGVVGLISKQRGKINNRQYSESYKKKIQEAVTKEYADFGPTLAAEKLNERQGLIVSKETLRQWMLEWGFWKAKRQKKLVLHQQRERREHFGELIQIDGSPHDWFEGRRAKCCLLVFIDDATSELLHLRFEERETTTGYFRALWGHIKTYGLPLALYSDKFSVFRINHPNVKTEGETQFARACRELGITLICANSPQAKGRVERANSTLQDRLAKELRLRGINDIETANAFLPSYREDHNKRFGVKPPSDINWHREVLVTNDALKIILSSQYSRVLSKDLEFTFEKLLYQIKTETKGYRLRHAKVELYKNLEGEMTIRYRGKNLPYRQHNKQVLATPVVGSKELNQFMDNLSEKLKKARRRNKPKADHPWRSFKNKQLAEKIDDTNVWQVNEKGSPLLSSFDGLPSLSAP